MIELSAEELGESRTIRQLLNDPQGIIYVELRHRIDADGHVEIYPHGVSGVYFPSPPICPVVDSWLWPLMIAPPFHALRVFIDIEMRSGKWMVQCSGEFDENGDIIEDDAHEFGMIVGGDPKGHGQDFISALLNGLVASGLLTTEQLSERA